MKLKMKMKMKMKIFTKILKINKKKNIYPIELILIKIDQLSSKIDLNNRQSDMIKKQYNEDFIMLRVTKVFNKYLSTIQSQNESVHDINSLLGMFFIIYWIYN